MIKIIITLLVFYIAAITDYKTGYIYDYITLPYILLGLIFAILEQNFTAILLAIIVFIVGFLIYKFGQIGGGDVKLLTGFTLFEPFFFGIPTILLIIAIAGIYAIIFYGIKNIIYFWNKKELKLILVMSIFPAIIFYNNIIVAISIYILTISSLINICFKKEIINQYKQKIKIKELLDDDLADLRVIGLHDMYPLDKKLFQKIKQIKKPEEEIIVYRNLPIFGPFLFLAVISFYLFYIIYLL